MLQLYTAISARKSHSTQMCYHWPVTPHSRSTLESPGSFPKVLVPGPNTYQLNENWWALPQTAKVENHCERLLVIHSTLSFLFHCFGVQFFFFFLREILFSLFCAVFPQTSWTIQIILHCKRKIYDWSFVETEFIPTALYIPTTKMDSPYEVSLWL